MPVRCRVMIVEEGEAARVPACSWLRECGYVTTEARGAVEATAPAPSTPPPCAVLVNASPQSTWRGKLLEVVSALRARLGAPVIVLGPTRGEPVAGADISLRRPLDPVALIAAVEVVCFGHDHERHTHDQEPYARGA